MSTKKIGIFDSGLGGLTIWSEIVKTLPLESTIYLADSLHAPYGLRSKTQIIELCKKNTDFLLENGVKLIVVACNTATTNAIDFLRANYDLPFIGIEPAIKPAALNTQTKAIGVLATKGTLTSALFHKTTKLYEKGIKVIEQEGTGIVEMIENGAHNSPEMERLLIKYLQPMMDANIDYLVLGCSHYPFLLPMLKKLLPSNITIIDSGQAVAKQTEAVLKKHNLLLKENLASLTHQLYSNKSAESFTYFIEEQPQVQMGFRHF